MRILENPEGEFRAMAFHPRKRLLATANSNNVVHLWDLHGYQTVGRVVLPGSRGTLDGLVWTPEGDALIAGSSRSARMWVLRGANDGVELSPRRNLGKGWPTHSLRWGGAVALPDGGGFMVPVHSHSAVATLRLDRRPTCHRFMDASWAAEVSGFDATADGRTLAVGLRINRILIWAREELLELPLVDGVPTDGGPGCQPRATFWCTGGELIDLHFSGDDTRLICAANRTVGVWSTADWRCLLELTPSSKGVCSTALSPDGRLALCGVTDGSVRVIDIDAGAERARFDFDLGRVPRVSFSSDGMTAAAYGGKRLVIWDVE